MLWLLILEGRLSLSLALFVASASMLPLSFAPEGFRFLLDSASEYAKLMYASPSDARSWSVIISSRFMYVLRNK